jgi:hypothetical protein
LVPDPPLEHAEASTATANAGTASRNNLVDMGDLLKSSKRKKDAEAR